MQIPIYSKSQLQILSHGCVPAVCTAFTLILVTEIRSQSCQITTRMWEMEQKQPAGWGWQTQTHTSSVHNKLRPRYCNQSPTTWHVGLKISSYTDTALDPQECVAYFHAGGNEPKITCCGHSTVQCRPANRYGSWRPGRAVRPLYKLAKAIMQRGVKALLHGSL